MINNKKTIFSTILIFVLIGGFIIYFNVRNKDDFNNINLSKSVLITTNEFINVEEMKKADLSEGDIVSTKGYFEENDNGGATYEIITYDKWHEELPLELKAVAYHFDGLGNPEWDKTPVDEFGNHTLNNGLVARIIIDEIIKVEQWGCRGDGISDNTEPLIHLFAHTKKGYIQFKENLTYLMKSRSINRKGIEINNPAFCTNEYIALMCGELTAGAGHGKPLMANIDGVVLDGNGCTIKVAENDYCKATNDFGIFEFGKSIKNLEIKNFTFDGNGLSQLNWSEDGEVKDMRTTNHTIVYMPGWYTGDDLPDWDGNLTDFGTNNQILKDVKNEFSNVNIHDNTFKNNGTGVNTQDSGGDFILIINPDESHDVYIQNNYFEDWGRWVFSVDLGGNGECFENYKFNNNRCVQTENNVLENGQYRGLGWIDFEARKCWKNLEVKNNYVEGVVGFAINGNGKISENVTISGNTIVQPDRDYKSSYEYMFEFYSAHFKNLIIENNDLRAGGGNIGLSHNGLVIKNNKITGGLELRSLFGDIIIDGNKREDKESIVHILGVDVPEYIDETEKKYCNITFINNKGGISGSYGQQVMFLDTENIDKYKYIQLKIENNDSKIFNISAWGLENFTFNPSQLDRQCAGYSVRGAKFTEPIYSYKSDNPVPGGALWEFGDVVSNNVDEIESLTRMPYYKDMNIEGKNKFIVKKAGYLPMYGAFLLAEDDYSFEDVKNNYVTKYMYIYTDSDLYITCGEGILGNSLTHKEGKAMCGEVELLQLANLAQIEAIE